MFYFYGHEQPPPGQLAPREELGSLARAVPDDGRGDPGGARDDGWSEARCVTDFPARVAYLDADERRKSLDPAGALHPTRRAIVVFAMLTSPRLSKRQTVTWGSVGTARQIMTFRKAKKGKVRHVPINPALHAVLGALDRPPDQTTPLFPAERNGRRVTTAFRRVATAAGLRGFRFHDLRHDFASGLTTGGVNIRATQKILRDADLRMTERCSHMAERVLAAVVQGLPALPVLPANENGRGAPKGPQGVPVRVAAALPLVGVAVRCSPGRSGVPSAFPGPHPLRRRKPLLGVPPGPQGPALRLPGSRVVDKIAADAPVVPPPSL